MPYCVPSVIRDSPYFVPSIILFKTRLKKIMLSYSDNY